jgi:monothiol glutaredoxin
MTDHTTPHLRGTTPMTDENTNPLREEIQQAISEHPVLLFMKGTPEQPACGFSARTVAILQSLGQPFAAVNVLPDPRIRQELSALSNWPTIPQLFIESELVGGCDIVTEMYQSGELQRALGVQTEAPGDAAPDGEPVQSAPLSIENRL